MDELYHSHEIEEELEGCCLNCLRSYRCIRQHLLHFYGQIRGLETRDLESLSYERLFATFEELDDIAHLEITEHLAEAFLQTPEIRAVLPEIRSYYSRFFSLHELQLAREISRSDMPWTLFSSYPLYDRYIRLVSREMRGLGLQEGSRIAFVGSGPLPISLILIGSLFGHPCFGVDTDERAVTASRQVVHRLGLADRIHLLQGDERTLREADWDAVLVAALAEPKKRIFRALGEIIDEKGFSPPIAARTYTGMRAVLYHQLSEDDTSGFQRVLIVPPEGRVNNTTIILERTP